MALGDRIGQLRKEAARSPAELGGEIDDIPRRQQVPPRPDPAASVEVVYEKPPRDLFPI
jgi:hypothetical protein